MTTRNMWLVNGWEICEEDKLIGYALFFSGGWDAYLRQPNGSLTLVKSNVTEEQEAIEAVKTAAGLS